MNAHFKSGRGTVLLRALRAFALGLLFAANAPAVDQFPPGKLTFQGYLSDATGAPLGRPMATNVTVVFRLYRNATGTNAADIVWGEQQSVTVNNGFFSALLGSGSPTGSTNDFFTANLASLFTGPDASDRFLGVTVVGQGTEISPRIQFFSSPFAYLSRATAALLNENSVSVISTASNAAGINIPGAPAAMLDINGNVKALGFSGDGSAITGIPITAASITGTFSAAQIPDGTVTGAKLANQSVGAAQLVANSVNAAKLSPDAALAVAGQAGGVGNGGVIVSGKKLDTVLRNLGYVNIGQASFDGPKWTIRATKDTPNAPTSRLNRIGSSENRQSATIWTGSKWIMYSGMNFNSTAYITDGGIFDPALNSWTPISTVNAPVPRDEINFIWSGTKGIFWGGHNGGSLAAGALYDPVANQWSAMNATGEPAARNRHRSVWTGSEMFVWGGCLNSINNNPNNGGLYSLATNGWRAIAAAPIAGRRDYNCFWTGSEVLVWGGVAAGTYKNDGALYNPVSNTWRLMSTVNAPTAREAGMAVFTGKEFIVWGGNSTTSLANSDGGRYDVATDTWIPFFTPNIRFFFEGAAFWNGSKVYFVQGQDGAVYVNEGSSGFTSGWSFDPSNNKWDYLPQAPITQSWMPHAWTGTELLTFATFRDGNDRTVLSFKPETETYFYAKTTPSTDKWDIRATKDTPNAPLPRVQSNVGTPTRSLWTGSKFIVWGDVALPMTSGAYLNSGGMFDPANNSWQLMTLTNAPSPRTQFSAVWTGSKAIYWGGFTNNFTGDGELFDPVANSWTTVNPTNAPSARCRHSAVWTGTEMIVWGGSVNTTQGVTNNGARYNPVTDTWTAMAASPLSNRCDHVAIWTGTEMLIWGGSTNDNINLGAFGNGARYNPATDSWTPMSSVNAPIARSLPLGVWTGTELIIWGGFLGLTNSNTGARYNPATDTWTPFDTGSYTWSQEATAVWTGSKVLFAGGANSLGLVNQSGIGGITYTPSTGAVGTLPVAPINQRNMTYAWTGTELLTFGAWDDFEDRTVLSYRPSP